MAALGAIHDAASCKVIVTLKPVVMEVIDREGGEPGLEGKKFLLMTHKIIKKGKKMTKAKG